MSPENAAYVANDIYRLVRDRVRYVSDPASEEFSDAQQVLEQGEGDCDDKVRCFVALCRCLKLEAHVRPVMRGRDFVHVQAVVRFPGSERDPRALADGWLVAELIMRDATLGDDVGDVPLDEYGRPRYA
jgi:transglutaminase-like putative cysteine protease